MIQLDLMRMFCLISGIYFVLLKECLGTLWRRDLNLEQKRMTGIATFTSVMDLPRCSMSCFRNEACNFFVYDKDSNTCLGFSRFATSGDKYTHAIKPEAYIKVVLKTKITAHYEKRNYADASATCVKYGGQLLSLDTKEKQEYMITNFTDPNNVYWVGLNDQTTEGRWTWENGKPFVHESSIFETQMNNYDSAVPPYLQHNADCAYLLVKYKTFTDNHCSNLANFLCEKKVVENAINY